MLDPKLEAALNAQLRMEFQAAYTYLGMSAYCAEQSLPGMAAWLKKQAEEEEVHAFKFYGFILEREGHVELRGLDPASTSYRSPLEIFEAALANERSVSTAIHAIYEVAKEVGDVDAQRFLDWFVDEQVEEEESVSAVVDDLKRVIDDNGLVRLDRRLGRRGDEAA